MKKQYTYSEVKIFKEIIPEMACKMIIEEGLSRKLEEARTTVNNPATYLPGGRSTKVAFMNNEFIKSFIYELVTKHYPKYEIWEAEDLQFAVYNKGDYYGWHRDWDPTNDRVLSVTVELSKPSDYEGGELYFDYAYYQEQGVFYEPLEKAQGTVIVFPSNELHEVDKVTKGTRYSLVQWFKGRKIPLSERRKDDTWIKLRNERLKKEYESPRTQEMLKKMEEEVEKLQNQKRKRRKNDKMDKRK